MAPASVIERRRRSHRLSAPARDVVAAASHLLAVQAQDFGAGRWALGVRAAGAPTLRTVDAAFDRGELVRSWTMRGTIHVVRPGDLAWMLSLTAERQRRQAAATHRREGIDDAEAARAENVTRAALRGGGRLTRAELFAVLEAGRVSTAGQRGYHLIVALALRGVVCWGPVVPREGGPTREQYLVLCDEWIRSAATPAHPLAELFARYLDGHAPASVRDFAWWTGLPLTAARAAAEGAGERVTIVEEGADPLYAPAGAAPRRSPRSPDVVALPAFDEYYLAYADRTRVCAPALLDVVGPSKNGMVRPVLLARGEVVGVWTHSLAVGRHEDDPVPELLVPGAASADEVGAALARYRAFILG